MTNPTLVSVEDFFAFLSELIERKKKKLKYEAKTQAQQIDSEEFNQKIDSVMKDPMNDIIKELWNDPNKKYHEIAEIIKSDSKSIVQRGTSERTPASPSTIERRSLNLYSFLNELFPFKKKFGRTINKTSFKELIILAMKLRAESSLPTIRDSPDKFLPLNSELYIQRKEEKLAREYIEDIGIIIIVSGSRKIGTTSLLIRLEEYAEKILQDKVVRIDFSINRDLNKEIFRSKKSFYLWFCEFVSKKLGMEGVWIENNQKMIVASEFNNVQLTEYFEQFILPNLSETIKSIILIFDRVDIIYKENSEMAQDFFALIRVWYNYQSELYQWAKIKYIIATSGFSVESLMRNTSSPFNVGEEIKLRNFNDEQIIDLAKRYKVKLAESEIERLREIFGSQLGLPYLIGNILYYIKRKQLSFDQFIQIKFTALKPFKSYVERKEL